jgi:hypothetical protein
MEAEPVITYDSRITPALQFSVNFGIFAGREVSRREIEKLAQRLLAIVPGVSVSSEFRYELGRRSEAEVHQVRIEVSSDALPTEGDVDAHRERLASVVRDWARGCIAGYSGAEMTYAERAARDAVVELTREAP